MRGLGKRSATSNAPIFARNADADSGFALSSDANASIWGSLQAPLTVKNNYIRICLCVEG